MGRKVFRGLFLTSASALIIAASICANAKADDLSSAYELVLKNPADAGASLAYAKLAEQHGKPRLALAAYERILLNDPENAEARIGLQRLRRELQPTSTQFRLEAGTAWETNPDNVSSGARSEPSIFGNLAFRDERSAGTFGWRTTGAVGFDFVNNDSDINYEYLGIGTGPVLDVTPGLSVNPAIGVAAANLANKLFYREANVSSTFEGAFAGAYETLRIRGGVRHYGPYFTSDSGYYADARGKVSLPGLLGEQDVLVIAPSLKWSGIDGSVTNISQEEIQPGRYREWGLELAYYFPLTDSITIGPDVVGWQRYYSEQLTSGEKRRDDYIAPGASVVFKDLLAFQSDLKVEYSYKMNRSNDDFSDYHDHEIRLSVISNF